MRGIETAQISDLSRKIEACLQAAGQAHVDLLVFPEYAVPPHCLPQVRAASRHYNMTVVAGSHLVRSSTETAAFYKKAGLEDLAARPADFVRTAVAPVFLGAADPIVRFKENRSKWEPDLKTRANPTPSGISIQSEGREIVVQLRICIDALTNADLRAGELLVVTAATPSTNEFETMFKQAASKEVASVFSNTALVGRSCIVGTQQTAPSAFDSLLTVPGDDEILLIADVATDEQHGKRHSVWSTQSLRLVGRLPLLFRRNPAHAELADRLSLFKKDGRLPDPSILADGLSERIPPAFRDQLAILFNAVSDGTADNDDVKALASVIEIPDDVPPFANRCLQACNEAITRLADILPGDPSNPQLLNAISALGIAIGGLQPRVCTAANSSSPLSEDVADRDAPFVDRQGEQERLRSLLVMSAVIVVQGLSGIGKRRLVTHVLSEVRPRVTRHHIVCTPGMDAQDVEDEIVAHIGYDLQAIKGLSASTRMALKIDVIVGSAHHIDFSEPGGGRLLAYLDATKDSGIRIIFVADYQLYELRGFPSVVLRGMGTDDIRRLLEYWCKLYEVDLPPELPQRLQGYPLAAKYALGLLRAHQINPLDRLKFFREIRRGIVEYLAEVLELSADERRAVEGLSGSCQRE
jgi:hypothetical protein